MYEETNGEALIATGVGQHQMWAAQYYKFARPRCWSTSGGLGSMGFGLPSAIGVAAAFDGTSGRPRKVVVDIDGDGSFLMNCQVGGWGGGAGAGGVMGPCARVGGSPTSLWWQRGRHSSTPTPPLLTSREVRWASKAAWVWLATRPRGVHAASHLTLPCRFSLRSTPHVSPLPPPPSRLQELATVAIEGLDTKVFILNNQHLGMVAQWEDRFYKHNHAHTYLGKK